MVEQAVGLRRVEDGVALKIMNIAGVFLTGGGVGLRAGDELA
jgi:hypothetical protein